MVLLKEKPIFAGSKGGLCHNMGRYNSILTVERDIARCRDVLENHPKDKEKLAAAFYEIFPRYMDVEGFSKGLQVVNEYDDELSDIQTYVSNISIMQERLEDYFANKCEGLSRNYVKDPEVIEELFEGAVYDINALTSVSDASKRDILIKLEEIKRICLSENTLEEKWAKLRPYIMWLSGKDVKSAMIILPLIARLD